MIFECEIISEDFTGKKAHVTDLIKQHITFPVFTFQQQYFPLRPCFGFTINRAQGQTLQFVGLDLRTSVFSHGILYVALSNWYVPFISSSGLNAGRVPMRYAGCESAHCRMFNCKYVDIPIRMYCIFTVFFFRDFTIKFSFQPFSLR